MSIAGGLEHAIEAARRVGCECLQLFVRNQRRWTSLPLGEDTVARFRQAKQAAGLRLAVAHASYLVNLASPDLSGRKQSCLAMIDELERCEGLGLAALIVHPGSYLDGSPQAGIRRIVASVNRVQRACAGYRCRILLETTAGQGTSIGYRFEQLAGILGGVREPQRLGVCLDTCHLFAAGYDFRTDQSYAAMTDALGRIIGFENVHAVHMNDSKRELGSRVDRHEHIGKGKIGRAGFAHFVNDPRFAGLPMILETPKGTDGRGSDLDVVNLKRLRGLIRG